MNASQAYKKSQRVQQKQEKRKFNRIDEIIKSDVNNGELYTTTTISVPGKQIDYCPTLIQLKNYLEPKGYKVFECKGSTGNHFAVIVWGPEDQLPKSIEALIEEQK